MSVCRLCLIILGITVLIELLGCAGSSNRIANDFCKAAHTALSNRVNTVSISSVTDFKWDKVFVFSPYTPEKSIDAELGYNWSAPAKARVAASEAEYLIVFTKDGKVVRSSEWSRKCGDFELLKSGHLFPYGADIFSVTLAPNSARLIFTPKGGKAVK